MYDPAQARGASGSGGSRVAMGCLAAFMLPFFLAGAFVLVQAFRQLQRGAPLPTVVMMLGFGTVFCGMALTVIVGAAWGLRIAAALVALRAANPDRPWLWRQDGISGVVRENRSGALMLWPFAIFWNAVSFPLLFVVPRAAWAEDRLMLIAWIFPVIGVCLLAAASYATARRAKFGVSTCTLDRIPIEPGRTFRGELQARVRRPPESGFHFVLTSARLVTTGSGKSRSTTEYTLWQETRAVSPAVAMPSPEGMRVPFEFEVPPDAQSADDRTVNDRVVWRLDVSAELPGVDYAARFELPVFQTGDPSQVAEKIATYQVAHRQEFTRRELPRDSQVTLESLPSGGTEFRIRPRRDSGSVVSTTIFLVIWLGAIALMIRLRAPIGFPIFFALFALILVAAILDAFFGRSLVRAERSGLMLQRSWLGYKYVANVAAGEVESIVTKPTGSSKKPLYDVEIRVRSRTSRRTVGCYLADKDDAEIVAARMWSALGRE